MVRIDAHLEDDLTSVESEPDNVSDVGDGQPWCPAKPSTDEKLTEDDLTATAEKIAIMMEQGRKSPGFFHSPRNFGALPDLWLQQKFTISFKQFFDKWARVLVVVAVAVWLRGDVGEVESTVRAVARSLPSD